VSRKKIIWSPSAVADLREIFEYVSQDSLSQAKKLVLNILDRVKRLPQFPNLGRVVPEIGQCHYRELIFKEYRIFHEVREKEILIFRILHAKRFFKTLQD
jgi:toxin ParE1/3/4